MFDQSTLTRFVTATGKKGVWHAFGFSGGEFSICGIAMVGSSDPAVIEQEPSFEKLDLNSQEIKEVLLEEKSGQRAKSV